MDDITAVELDNNINLFLASSMTELNMIKDNIYKPNPFHDEILKQIIEVG